MHDTLQYEAVRRYQHSMEYVHPPSSIHFSFRSIYNTRNRIVLLLFLLVSTCQISVLPLKIREHALYNCG